MLNFKNSVKFVSRWLVDGLDHQALTASLHFIVKVVAWVGGKTEAFVITTAVC